MLKKYLLINFDKIYIILFSGKYNINLIDIESFDTKFSRFWGGSIFI